MGTSLIGFLKRILGGFTARLKDWRFILLSTAFNFVTRPLTDRQYIVIRHILKYHRIPNLENPKLYSEKIHWRMLYDRKAVYKEVADKLALREYAKRKGLQEFLPELLFETSDPHQIPIKSLPSSFMVKANHGSGMVLPVPYKQSLDVKRMYKLCNRWLRTDYYYRAREWQYHNLPRKIMVEELLGDGESSLTECVVYCFEGEPRLIVMVEGRNSPSARIGRYDLEWSPLDFPGSPKITAEFRKPARFSQLIEIARLFSSGFDHIRVDMYLLKERIVLGELTLSAAAGFRRIGPEHQKYLGDLWNLPEDSQVA